VSSELPISVRIGGDFIADYHWVRRNCHGSTYDLEMAKDSVGKHAARMHPHPHDESDALQPI